MIHEISKDIIRCLHINKFVETGTFAGETVAQVSMWLADLDPDFGTISDKIDNEYLNKFSPNRKIYYPIFKNPKINARTRIISVDIDKDKIEVLKNIFAGNPNIKFINSSSERFLREAIDDGLILDNDNSLFYLDAHWGEDLPLHDELRQILRLKRCVIVIDDFVVPFHPFHRFDVYKTKVYGWYYIRELFKNLRIDVYYPKKYNIDKRGTIIIFVGYSKEDLKFMNNLPCFKASIFKGDPFITLAAKGVSSILILTGLYPLILNYYLRKKWGSAQRIRHI